VDVKRAPNIFKWRGIAGNIQTLSRFRLAQYRKLSQLDMMVIKRISVLTQNRIPAT
jgi:hypothetical protein